MNKRYLKYIHTLIVVQMSLIMAVVGIARNYGFEDEWISKVFDAWLAMLPVAFLVIPVAGKLTEKVSFNASIGNDYKL